jgi:hypothetical protein
MAQPVVNIAFPDADSNGIADPLIQGQSYDFNIWARKFPGNVSLQSTGDSITFMALFQLTGCQTDCINCYNNHFALHYGGDGRPYGIYGEDREYLRNTIFKHSGDYLLVGSTAKGFAIRKTISVVPDCANGGNIVSTQTLELKFSQTTTGTVIVEDSQTQPTFYPNPVVATLQFTDVPEGSEIVLYNTSGQLVRTVDASSSQMDISDLPSGMYIVHPKKEGIQFESHLIMKK